VTGGGIAITSGGLAVNGGGIQVGAGGLAVTGGHVTIPGASTIMGTPSARGGPLIVYGNNIYLEAGGSNQAALKTDNIGSVTPGNTMRITGVSTINDMPYPPSGSMSPDLVVSTLTAANGISTNQLYANIITGTGVIIGSEPGQGITLGTGATEVNVTTDMYIASPNILSASVIEEVVLASISTIIDVSTINGQPYPPPAPPVYQGTYYKSAPQTLSGTGNTDITFDLTGSWNNTGGYITHTNGTTVFTVVQTGIYQLEFNASVLANGAVYSLTNIGKSVAIDITRPASPVPEQSVIINSALQASLQNYAQSVSATYYLLNNDVINLRVGNLFTGGPPTVQSLQSTFDLNTFFTWRFIS
jgi:hypothetical protein